MRKMRKT